MALWTRENFGDRLHVLRSSAYVESRGLSMGNGRGFRVIWAMWPREARGLIIIANNGAEGKRTKTDITFQSVPKALEDVQGDHSGCFKPPIDTKAKVMF